MTDLDQVFAEDGLLTQKLPGYQHREGQKQMAHLAAHAFKSGTIAMIEAGTGTGKSLAYLVPALLAARETGVRTVISTHTINLQGQLIDKDLPQLLKILAPHLRATLIKGMSNYLCKRKLGDALEERSRLSDDIQEELTRIGQWAQATDDGSLSDLPLAPERAAWDRVAAERESCNHVRCPFYKECHFFRARHKAEDADLLVVNHHLLMADLKARESETNLLPQYDHLVVDEAHHLEEVATESLAFRVSRRQVIRWLELLAGEGVAQGGKLALLAQKLAGMEIDDRKLSMALETDLPLGKTELLHAVNDAFRAIGELAFDDSRLRLRQRDRETTSWTEEIEPSFELLIDRLKAYSVALEGLDSALQEAADKSLLQKLESVRQDIHSISERLSGLAERLNHFIFEEIKAEEVRWVELSRRGNNVQLVNAQLDVSELLRDQLFQMVPSTVLTSATLTAGGSFAFYRKRLGLDELDVQEALIPSPFNYQEQAQVLLAQDLSLPSDKRFSQQVSEAVLAVTKAIKGDTFVLFTSYRMLRECFEMLESKLQKAKLHPLRQGQASREQILDEFRATKGAVLFGTDSFWEGVDVVGDALRCVILTKLPFKVPTEPLVEARMEAISAKGGNPFGELSLPEAVVKFKQGCGRLIRSSDDTGTIICLDPRLTTKPYGRVFLKSLPECPQVKGPIQDLVQRLQMTSKVQ